MNKLVQEISANAKAAVSVLNSMSTESKNNLLIKATKNIHQSRKKILLANKFNSLLVTLLKVKFLIIF